MKGDIPVLKPQLVGTRVMRSEDTRLLTGRGNYIADLHLPKMLHMAVLRSPMAHARITSVNADAASALSGVHAVWTGADVSGRCPGIQAGHQIEGMKATVQPILATDVVRYVGEPVAVVVASSRHVGEDALELIELDLEPLTPLVDAEAAISSSTLANETLDDNVILVGERDVGDVDAETQGAAVRVHGRFRHNRCTAAPMETRGCVAAYEWTTNQLRLWSATQIPHFIKSMIAMFTGFPEHDLEVITPDVGGGFGQKAHLFPEEVLVCLLAKELGCPVRWIEDRQENLLTATHAKDQINDMEIALTQDGRILALRQDVIGDGGAYNSFPWTHIIEPMAAAGTVTSVYDIPNLKTRFTAVVTNKCPVGAYRGIGWTAPQIAREALLDRAAHQLNLSPFEIRRRNVVKPDQFPYTSATGLTFHEGSYLETLDALERAANLPAFLERQRQAREEGRHIGLGISLFNEVNGMGTRACFDTGFPVTTYDTSTVRLEPTGKVTVTTSIVSQGQGHETTLAQVAADALGVPLDDVVVRAGNTGQTYGIGTWGSRGAVIGAGSILRAADVVRRHIRDLAAHMLEASPEDLVMENGSVHVAGAPEQGMPLGQLAAAAYFAEVTHPEGYDPALEVTATFDGTTTVFSNGGHLIEVEVDVETGLVHVQRCVAVEDCGVMINPMVVEGQIRGGVAQAIGSTLYEDLVYDESGQLLTTTFLDYLLPTAREVPDVEFIHLETPSAFTPGGIKGMGESSMISVPAAIVNAVNDALTPFGVFLDVSPLTPERIVKAINGAAR